MTLKEKIHFEITIGNAKIFSKNTKQNCILCALYRNVSRNTKLYIKVLYFFFFFID